MSKQSIYVKHKDEIFLEYKRIVEVIMENYENGMNRDYTQGKKEALEWVLGLDKIQEEKEKEFSDKIDALTNKGENNDSSNK
jgi:ribosomal protein S17E